MASQTTTVLFGLPIPSSNPIFLGIVGVHVLFGLAAVVAGAIAMLSKKAVDNIRTSALSIFGACLASLSL